ncbi:MAG: Caib/baif family protein, partial [Candidatus Peregrinibacteria bacterium GW2011_GWA2_47_7]
MHFFEELQKLRESRPMPNIIALRSENCDYCPYHAAGKNCYLIVGHVQSEDCYYGFWLGASRDCMDCAFTEKSELCYECVDIQGCYNCSFCQDCMHCSELDFCYDCKSSQNCFGSVNLRNKQFHIFNVPYPKDEYFEKVRTLKKQYNRLDVPPPEFLHLKATLPHNAMHGVNNENALGDHIFNSKNAFYCFDVSDQEDTKYIYNSMQMKDSMDCNYSSL